VTGSARPPFFSVVVPTRNRPDQLVGLLEALCRQAYPAERFEVVLVDDGSDQPLDAVIEPFRGRLSITLLRQPHAGVANARQRGTAAARGDFLAFTDDDCRPAPDWLARLAEFCVRHPGAAVGGSTINALTKNPFSEASQITVNYLVQHSNVDRENAVFFPHLQSGLPRKTICFHRWLGS
jgi:glycosyltransferase involved in cell wall biosynthesis